MYTEHKCYQFKIINYDLMLFKGSFNLNELLYTVNHVFIILTYFNFLIHNHNIYDIYFIL